MQIVCFQAKDDTQWFSLRDLLPLLEGLKTALILIGLSYEAKKLLLYSLWLYFYRCFSVYGGRDSAPMGFCTRGVCIQGVGDLHPGAVCMPGVGQTTG